LKTRKAMRLEKEKKIREEGGKISYPTWEALRAEDEEEKPALYLTVRDAAGEVVRRITGPTGKGIHRVAWDLRFPAYTPARLESNDSGPMVLPGEYSVAMEKRVDGEVTVLGAAQSFEAVPLNLATLPAEDRLELLAFQQKTGRLQRAVLGARRVLDETKERIDLIKAAVDQTPAPVLESAQEARRLEKRLAQLRITLLGDSSIERRMEPIPPAILSRVQSIVSGHWNASTSAPTQSFRDSYEVAADAFESFLADLKLFVEQDLYRLERKLDDLGAPWTPGRLPVWSRE
ncbi:MAG: glycosyl hydrolase, partial [Planctomycetes bacterium]|nr:glycosyl hydrolase [Planctomycetota bacterium]